MTGEEKEKTSNDWPIQSNMAREIIRKRGELFETEMGLYKSKGSVQCRLPAIAFDEYAELPDSTRMIYDPETHSILIDLPKPKNRDVQIVDFLDPSGSNKPHDRE